MSKTIQLRRKRENKTDYKARLNLLKSDKVRFVIRKSLKNMIIQAINYQEGGDKVLFTSSSSQLKKLGWKFSLSNTPSAYLTGLIAGLKAKELGIKSGIVDIGLQSSIKGSKIYGSLKGLLDAGIDIPHSKDILPDEKRIMGKHIDEFKKNDISKTFDLIKNKIMA